MKKLLFALLMVIGSWLAIGPEKAAAREGSIDLTSSEVSCKGISLYQDGYYRIFGRCDGLVYPYETTNNKYVLWGRTIARGEQIRIAEIEKGYFSGNIASPFGDMSITAEGDGLVRRPSDRVILSGGVTPFDFDKSQVTASPTPAPATGEEVDAPATRTGTAGAVVGRILTALLVIVLVIVGLVIGASLLFRSRGSVSA